MARAQRHQGPGGPLRLGESDCERIRNGPIAQPFNALTSLALLVVAANAARRAARASGVWRAEQLSFSATVAATGFGSFLFHGPQPRLARWVHDVSISSVLLFVALHDTASAGRWEPRRALTCYAACVPVLGALLADAPSSANVLTAVLTAAAASGEARAWRRRPRPARVPGAYARRIGALALGLVAFVLGRSGSPLCNPDRFLQLHGLWHVLAALALDGYSSAVIGSGSRAAAVSRSHQVANYERAG